MESDQGDFITRRPTLSDSLAVLDLITAVDMAAYGEPDYDLDSLLDEWSNMSLDQDAWLVQTRDDQLIGYATVTRVDHRFSLDLYVHPSLAPEGLADFLLAMCEIRCMEQMGTEIRESSATLYIPQTLVVEKQAVEERGYQLIKYHSGMRIDLPAPPLEPSWPEGVSLRNVVPGQDDLRIYEFIQAAFDWPGRTPPSFERWRDLMMGASSFNPDLWFLAFHGDELVGAVLCFDYPQYGWVRQLGVAQTWRRHGLGAALLQHIFGVFYRRGHRRVGLAVESSNPRAFQFYERVGMHCLQQYLEYRKTLTRT